MIRYALRTTLGAWVVLATLFVQVLNVAQRGGQWTGDLLWAADAQAISLVIVAPLLCAAVAVDTARVGALGRAHLVLLSHPRLKPIMFTFVAGFLPVGIGTASVTFGSIAWSARALTDFSAIPGALVLMVVQVAALFFFASLGSAVGRTVNPLAAGICAAAASLALFLTHAGARGGFSLTTLGGSTNPRVGLDLSLGYAAAQTALFVVIGALFLVTPVTQHRGRIVMSRSGVLLTAVALLLLLVPKAFLPDTRWDLDPHPPTDCRSVPVEVCTYTEHRSQRAIVEPHINALVAAARAQGYDALVPDRVDEMSRTYVAPAPSAGHTVFGFELDSMVYEGRYDERVDAWATMPSFEVTKSLLTPIWCEQLYTTGPSEEYWTDVYTVAVTWERLAGATDDDLWFLELGTYETPLTPTEVASIMERFRTCDI